MKKSKSKTKPAFVEVREPMADGDTLLKRLPANAAPALARIGDTIRLFAQYAKIVSMTRDWRIAELEDGTTDAVRWGEVDLCHVRPDPSSFAVRPPRAASRSPVRR